MPQSPLQSRFRRFGLRTLFALVSAAAIGCGVLVNLESIVCRIKYGDPVDLADVEMVGINDDTFMLAIAGQRVNTHDSRSVALWKWHVFNDSAGDPPSTSINGVWRSRTDPNSFTVRIGDEFIATR